MAEVVKVVDGVSEPVTSKSACAVGGGNVQSVPLKIDASQMQKVLQSAIGQQMKSAGAAGVQTDGQTTERVNPSILMKNISDEMSALYSRFDRLKKLAAELHGRQLDSPMPEHIRLKNIEISFSLVKDGKEEEHTAEVKNVAAVGDLTPLLSAEFGLIILSLSEQAKQMEDLAQKTGERCSAALKEWETNNKDKKIVRTGDDGAISVDEQEAATPDAGAVTLEAS